MSSDKNVRVAVRARPLLPREVEANSPVVLEMRGQSTILFKSESGVAVGETRDASKEFVYDHSYWSVNTSDRHFASQEQIFADLGAQVLDSAFGGYNACVFAYGQTGSGKTYTMMGTPQSPGLIPRICEGLFSGTKSKSNVQVSYKIEISYMEIYNEKVRDLLRVSTKSSPMNTIHNLKVREHPKDGPYVENLSRHQVSDYAAIQELIDIGNNNRVTAATKMNDVSSRSHAIFTIAFNQAKYVSGIPSETVSKIHLVDLAGSERASQTGAEGQRLKEGGNINKSLVCLGNVISALAELSTKRKPRYIPYRDSTLTWLLKDSLGGNAKTIMVATVSPCEYSYAETLSTLRYANRAKNIVNKPTVNEDPNVKLIRELQEEIKRLKLLIERGGFTMAPESSLRVAVDLHSKEEMIASLTRNWAGKWEPIQKIIEDKELALKSEGVKMTVASEHPHLLGVDEDRFSAGVVLYHLKTGDTTIGNFTAYDKNDIELRADDITSLHCKVILEDGVASLVKLEGACYINGEEIHDYEPMKLSHGDTLQLGSRTYFRFNHPQEAEKLRETSSDLVLSDSSFNPSNIISPFARRNRNTKKVRQLEKEKLALEERQQEIEQEYEQKISEVMEKLKQEEQDKASLQYELDRLREQKLTASMRAVTLTSSTPIRGNDQPDRFFLSVNSSSTSDSGSDTSDPNLSERQVVGREDKSSNSSSPKLLPSEDYPHLPRLRSGTDSSVIRQYSVSLGKDGDIDINFDNGVTSNSEDYIMLEPDLGIQSDGDAYTLDSVQSEVDRIRVISEQEKEDLKSQYEEKLQDKDSENERMRKELLELELQLQKSQAKSEKRRSYAFTHDENREQSLTRESLMYHSHREPKLKTQIPAHYTRGVGWSSYIVFEIQLTVGREQWNVYRRYEHFRDFHAEMCRSYPEINSLSFPPSKWFGSRNERFLNDRRIQLQSYMKAFIAIVSCEHKCPIAETYKKKVTRETVENFHRFFKRGVLEAPANRLL